MNGPGARPVDWPTVLTRAHRRVAIRLALAAGVGVVGAVLLLGGGSATRASIQDNASSSSPGGPIDPGGPGSEQPNLVIDAEAVEPAEGEEVAGEGRFTVTNESSTGAEKFAVVATAQSSGLPQVTPIPVLSAGENRQGLFECPPGDTVIVEIESDQPHEGPQEIKCADELTEVPETPAEPTEPPEPPGPTEPPEPLEEPKSPELE